MRSLSIVAGGVLAFLAFAAFAACLPQPPPPHTEARPASSVPADPFAASESRARTAIDAAPPAHGPAVLLQHATVMTATGKRYAPGFVLMEGGNIAAVAEGGSPAPK